MASISEGGHADRVALFLCESSIFRLVELKLELQYNGESRTSGFMIGRSSPQYFWERRLSMQHHWSGDVDSRIDC